MRRGLFGLLCGLAGLLDGIKINVPARREAPRLPVPEKPKPKARPSYNRPHIPGDSTAEQISGAHDPAQVARLLVDAEKMRGMSSKTLNRCRRNARRRLEELGWRVAA